MTDEIHNTHATHESDANDLRTTRRAFCERTAKLGVGLALPAFPGLWGASANAASAEGSESTPVTEASHPAESTERIEADVVVVGSGTAGLSAAVAAREAGARRVVLLEKGAITGGHGIYSSGSVSIARRKPEATNPAERDADVERMVREILEAGAGESNPELARILAEESESAVRWLAGMGVEWRPLLYRAVGAVTSRNISTGTPAAGYDYVTALAGRAKTLGVRFFHSTEALELLTRSGEKASSDIKVTGVRARRKSAKEGARTVDFVAPAVVLATGGFSANVAMRMTYDARLDARYPTTANPRGFLFDGATGDGIRMARAVGAKEVGMRHIQVIPYSGGRLLDFVGGEIWVNDEGKRFVSEGVPFGELADALHVTEGRSFWAISDASTQKSATLGVKLAEGIVREAQSIEALAAAIGVPLSNLSATIERWNWDARKGWDSTFERPLSGVPLTSPPFFYGRETWSVHFTCGGIAIDGKARVLSTRGRPILGLYAAGETTGGLHGRDRLGGNGLTETFVFGRIAGTSAAETASVKASLKEAG
ncbi:FAD-dependent oxidoreductase [Sutterella megalosphaeroides]|uniref:Flavocytochrome c n=1 Tax=Sutterella megalosphaeroides TaxID=2494234 RepID=A0A2Z6IA48_9BURK|nr:flavocytochrome c [Sutterella megalosphaeroides]BBF23393.1 flavocytochrome c [Sutterella megalosphaeroides]